MRRDDKIPLSNKSVLNCCEDDFDLKPGTDGVALHEALPASECSAIFNVLVTLEGALQAFLAIHFSRCHEVSSYLVTAVKQHSF
ncbi:hypothetical protein EVAR_25734_1 [Eumeta japonica]|uniref:Uncharacterized protein n=1 Tax=Eumeta variegata TaxID=151549 RepID=A0A4C1V853_EUMVA|nr:hypothetical protein EVAR_25734_1 [Eumeta japonica]